jgi:hypothetical protein
MSTPTRSPSRTGTADTPPGPRGGDTRPAGTHTLLGRGGELTGPPVPAVPAACRLHNRSEVVEFGARCGLRISTTTPHVATAEDLLFVRSVLDGAGIGYLLVRGNHTRPVLAVNWADRQALRTALVAACADQPFYVKAVGTGRAPGLIADGTLSHTPAARILRLFRPRLEPVSGLRYGAEGAVQVELWSYTDDEIAAPAANALTRPVMARREAVPAVIERDGRSWPTVAGMFDLHPADVPFPIDLVFSWVDGSDTRWQVQRARRMRNYVVGDGDDSPARYRQINELKYALRSVHMYAPWIRRIFVATDSPRPAWLADHTRVIVVRSEEFFTDPSVLPTHNSHAVESQLHRIPGLAEHFLYANDDMFFGRAVAPQLFFTAGSVSRFIESGTRIGLGRNCPRRSGFENAARVNRVLAATTFRGDDHPSSRTHPGAAAPIGHGRDGRAVPPRVRRDRGQPVPGSGEHLGDELALPLLRPAHRPRRAAYRRQGPLRRHHHRCGPARTRSAAGEAEQGHVLPQRRQHPGGRPCGAHRDGDRVPRPLLPHPGPLGNRIPPLTGTPDPTRPIAGSPVGSAVTGRD